MRSKMIYIWGFNFLKRGTLPLSTLIFCQNQIGTSGLVLCHSNNVAVIYTYESPEHRGI